MEMYPLVKNKRPREMKRWQDCQWRRIPCGREDCPICGREIRARKIHIERGEDPDSMESAMMDMSNTFAEVLDLMQNEAARLGVDLDEEMPDEDEPEDKEMPTDFPLYNELMRWRQGIYDIAESSDETSSVWLYTDAGEDLMWYSSTIMVKVYRQLGTIRRMKKGGDHYDLEYKYTGFVINEVLYLLDKALTDLSQSGHAHAREFNIARLRFSPIKDKILNYR